MPNIFSRRQSVDSYQLTNLIIRLAESRLTDQHRINSAMTRSSGWAQPVFISTLAGHIVGQWSSGGVQMTSIFRIAVPASSLFASGWLFRDPLRYRFGK